MLTERIETYAERCAVAARDVGCVTFKYPADFDRYVSALKSIIGQACAEAATEARAAVMALAEEHAADAEHAGNRATARDLHEFARAVGFMGAT